MRAQSILRPFLQAAFVVVPSLVSAQEEIIADYQHQEMAAFAEADPLPDAVGTLTLTPPSGLAERTGVTLSVFPNPSVDETVIVVPQGFDAGTLLIVDAGGRTVRCVERIASGEIRMSRAALPSGIYRIVFLDARGRQLTAGLLWE